MKRWATIFPTILPGLDMLRFVLLLARLRVTVPERDENANTEGSCVIIVIIHSAVDMFRERIEGSEEDGLMPNSTKREARKQGNRNFKVTLFRRSTRYLNYLSPFHIHNVNE